MVKFPCLLEAIEYCLDNGINEYSIFTIGTYYVVKE